MLTPSSILAVDRSKSEIRADVANGLIPSDVASFSELHDYVDANGYGGAFEDSPLCEEVQANCDFWNAVQDALDAWIKDGGLFQ